MSQQNYIVVDIETTGLDFVTDQIHGVGVYWPDGRTEYHRGGPSAELQLWLKNPAVNVVGHNLRFDLKFLQAKGYDIRCREWDTKLLAQLLNENQELGLKPLSEKYFGTSSLDNKRELDRAIASVGGKHVGDLCRADIEAGYGQYTDVIAEYCLEDCINTKNLWDKLGQEARAREQAWAAADLNPTPTQYYLEETMPLEKVLRSMEVHGIRVDLAALMRYRDQLLSENDSFMQEMLSLAKEHINAIENELYNEVVAEKKSPQGKANVKERSEKYGTKFNWQSSDHISTLIFRKFKAPTEGIDRTDTGKLSTSESTLETLRKILPKDSDLEKVLGLYAKWKKNLKLLTMYTGEEKGLVSQIVNERVHADYLQAGHGKESSQGGTVTGRLSSRNPNMQNLPRGSEIKRFFIPDPGHVFIYFDYSQLELRLAAHLSQDPLLIKAYREGLDLHQLTAKAIGSDRQMGKTINFAMIYDASPWRLAEIMNKTPEECKDVIQNFFALYPIYARYLKIEKEKMLKRGWVISETGRLRRLPELLTEEKFSRPWKHAIKQGYNFPIQSLGASVTKRAMIALQAKGYKLVTQVHDSVVIQIEKSKAKAALEDVIQTAENVYTVSVPLKVDAKILTSLHESDKWEDNNEQHSNNQRCETSTSRSA